MEKAPTNNESNDRDDSVHFTRHSKSTYGTYSKINASENPTGPVDVEDQVTPDLPPAGVDLANEKAVELLSQFNPETDALFFVSSSEARALETAAIYKGIAEGSNFEIVSPENVRGDLAEKIGEGDIRVVENLSLNIENTLVSSVFNPETHLGEINWDAVDKETKDKWQEAREVINGNDFGSWGANFLHNSAEVAKIFPEIKATKELYETQFNNLVRLTKFGMKKAAEANHEKNIKILAFGHENYMGYALQEHLGEGSIGNCETVSIDFDNENQLQMERL